MMTTGIRRFSATAVTAAVTALLLAAAPARAQNSSALLSAAVPGLGQLAGGQRAKGLGLMGAGLISLHFCLEQVSRYNTHARNTRILQEQYMISAGSSYDSRLALKAEWRESYEAATDAKDLILPFAGAYLLVWAAGIADALFFPQDGDASDTAGLPRGYSLAVDGTTPIVKLNVAF